MTKAQQAQVKRQGDVLLIPTTQRPSPQARAIRDNGRVILAYGEVTGHCHQVVAAAPSGVDNADPVAACELFEEPDGTRLLVLATPAALTHDEHGPAALDGGQAFIVRRQCEWTADDIRAVAD